ncbi:response regulator transcription factor [Sphingomonas sp. LaA6.9]|uniref:response regulator transcription factor n=1 Tax=Sphingomonas sp. LaA6.9 TaxID=2919914 RepID=UPI001F4FE007|nr:helix-turn-helix transcriptional regulator [Sphingomonas sp. LaA6.9]MCJ8156218.1 helix-turn-helix transcriptional regulator [Sphingomonas sp. LaA6.9]
MEHASCERLTARECEVLQLVSHGLSAKAIARLMAIAPRTVERHIDNLRLKVGARNRTHMIARACARGLLVITQKTHGAPTLTPGTPELAMISA